MKKLILTYNQINERLTYIPDDMKVGGSLDTRNASYSPDTPQNIIDYSDLTIKEFTELIRQDIIKIYKEQYNRKFLCMVVPDDDYNVIYGRVIVDGYSCNYSIQFVIDKSNNLSKDDILRLSELGLFEDTVILLKDYICSKIIVNTRFNKDGTYLYLSELQAEGNRLNMYQIAKKLVRTIW